MAASLGANVALPVLAPAELASNVAGLIAKPEYFNVTLSVELLSVFFLLAALPLISSTDAPDLSLFVSVIGLA